MKIIKYTKEKNNLYKLYLDNHEIVELYDEVILKNNLLLTKEIKDNQLTKLIQDNNYFLAYFDALKYLNKRMHAVKETSNYLGKKYSLDIVNVTIKKLEQDNYLNDENYVKAYINDQINLSNKGYYKILKELTNLDITSDLIRKYLDKIKSNIWEDRINLLIKKKIKSNHQYSIMKLKDKVTYDLVNLGYQKETIINILNHYNLNENDDILNKKYALLYNKLSKKYQGKELDLHLITKLISEGFNYNDIKRIEKKND